MIVLRCPICKDLFTSRWEGDELQVICDPCWYHDEAVVLPFRRPA